MKKPFEVQRYDDEPTPRILPRDLLQPLTPVAKEDPRGFWPRLWASCHVSVAWQGWGKLPTIQIRAGAKF